MYSADVSKSETSSLVQQASALCTDSNISIISMEDDIHHPKNNSVKICNNLCSGFREVENAFHKV